MDPFDLELPKDIAALATLYRIINRRVNKIWIEYTSYIENLPNYPQASLIFPIIFSELEFCEVILTRIASILPSYVVRELREDEYFSDW